MTEYTQEHRKKDMLNSIEEDWLSGIHNTGAVNNKVSHTNPDRAYDLAVKLLNDPKYQALEANPNAEVERSKYVKAQGEKLHFLPDEADLANRALSNTESKAVNNAHHGAAHGHEAPMPPVAPHDKAPAQPPLSAPAPEAPPAPLSLEELALPFRDYKTGKNVGLEYSDHAPIMTGQLHTPQTPAAAQAGQGVEVAPSKPKGPVRGA